MAEASSRDVSDAGEALTTSTTSGNNLVSITPAMAVDNPTKAARTTDGPPNGAATAQGDVPDIGRKRKSPGDSPGLDHLEATSFQHGHGISKKVKMAQNTADRAVRLQVPTGESAISDKSLLPPELWHHVFTFCPPKSLGRLLAVNKTFHRFLDPASRLRKAPQPSATPGALLLLEPNAIWQASRRLFWPQMPAPLRSKTELEMWRLACSPRCDVCGRLPGHDHRPSVDSRHPGPGPDGVAPIWVFGSRMCVACLLRGSHKVCAVAHCRRSSCGYL